ncbi:MAG: ATP:cob(I)alamin adenosyltransferase [Rhodospirillales bacterium]|nr:ATP:cob(I)alamin adenosyltransferase [Rhodospirillales bacterium]
MIRLDRLATRGGDKGETSLGDGTRVPKTHARVVALGAIDELNAAIGGAVAAGGAAEFVGLAGPMLARVQNELFDLGADLSVPGTGGDRLRVSELQVSALDRDLETMVARLKPLTSFVLPGGTGAAAQLHLARTVARRAEIAVWQLIEREEVNRSVPVYLNRLGDLLFALARAANEDGARDVTWVPGASR